MKLFILKVIPPFDPGHDVTHGLLIRADTEGDARQMADKKTNGEYLEGTIFKDGKLQMSMKVMDKPWLDPERTSCVEVLAEGKPEILLVNYLAG